MASITLKPDASALRIISLARKRDRPAGITPSLNGQTVVLTGGNSGFGLATAKILPTLGVARLIIGVRSMESGEIAAESIRKTRTDCSVEVWELDMLSYESVQAFAQRCAGIGRLDMAILNAGVVKLQFAKSPSTGHEDSIQVNYLSTALLSILLLPVLKPKDPSHPPGRLTLVGSSKAYGSAFAERSATPLLEEFDKEWSGVMAGSERYGVSKLLLQMFVYRLSKLVSSSDVIINNVCPGMSQHTALARQVPNLAFHLVGMTMQALWGRTAEQGAWTYIDAAAVKGKETHGSFIFGWNMFPFHPIMYTREGEEVAARLWNETMAEQAPFGVKEALRAMKIQ